jgi:hypothetical protein
MVEYYSKAISVLKGFGLVTEKLVLSLDWGPVFDWAAVVLPTLLAVVAATMTTMKIESRASKNSWRLGLVIFGVFVSGVTWEQQKLVREAAKGPLPDVHLIFVYPESPALILYDASDAPAENAIYSFGMWNLSGPADQLKDPLRIVSSKADFVRGHESAGPNNIFDVPGVKERLQPGDQLFGFVNVSCPRCVRTRQYWLSIKWGAGGWYAELPPGRSIDLVALAKAIPNIAKFPEQSFSELDVGQRHEIITWDELKTTKPPQ